MATPDDIRNDLLRLGKMIEGLEQNYLTMQERSMEALRIQQDVDDQILKGLGEVKKFRDLLSKWATKVDEVFKVGLSE